MYSNLVFIVDLIVIIAVSIWLAKNKAKKKNMPRTVAVHTKPGRVQETRPGQTASGRTQRIRSSTLRAPRMPRADVRDRCSRTRLQDEDLVQVRSLKPSRSLQRPSASSRTSSGSTGGRRHSIPRVQRQKLRPQEYPKCVICRSRNLAGHPQVIFYDEEKKQYKCTAFADRPHFFTGKE